MKLLKEVFLKDWKYKLAALIISVSLWSVVNFGSRTAITVSRYVEVRNPKPELVYRLNPDRVDITVYVVERLLLSRLIEEVKAYVDVSKIDKPGVYKLRVYAETAVPVLIHPTSVEPPTVRIRVYRKTAP
ncbi:hypothetical protein [Hydrogenivirga sp.]